MIVHIDRIVEAIGKQIISIHGFSRIRNSVIRANKPPELRAIVPAIEVIQPRLGIVVVTPVAEGILFAHGVAGGVGDGALAPGIVAVSGHHLARSGPHDGDDIPLHVVEIIIQRIAVGEAHPLARAVVDIGASLQSGRWQGSGRKGIPLYRFDIPDAVVGIDEGGVLGLAVVAYFLFLWCLICLGISLSYFIPCL